LAESARDAAAPNVCTPRAEKEEEEEEEEEGEMRCREMDNRRKHDAS